MNRATNRAAPLARPPGGTFAVARPVAGALAAAVLAGCTGGGGGVPEPEVALPAPAFGFAAPAPLLASRAVDREALEPVVRLFAGPDAQDGQPVSMTRIDGTAQWSGTVRVQPSTVVFVDVEWRVNLARGPLPLARAPRRRVEVNEVGGAAQLGAADYDYDTGLDEDGDGTSNFRELSRATDPFVAEGIATGLPSDDVPDANGPDGGPVPPADAPPDGGGPGPGRVTVPGIVSVGNRTPDDGPGDDPNGDPVEDPIGNPVVVLGDDGSPSAPDPVVIDLFVPRIDPSDAPDIDGRGVTLGADGRFGGQWAAAVQVDASGQPLGIDHLMIDQGADAPDGTPWRRWAAVHDGEYLYVVVSVEDDGARVKDSGTIWEDDSLEVFIDGDHSRNTAYGDDDDWHLFMSLLAPGTDRTPNSNAVENWQTGPFSTGEGLILEFATGPGIGPDGLRRPNFEQDVYELRIDLASANIALGAPFGFELQVNDDDDGGTRDSKWGWAHPSRVAADVDFTYVNPSFMGTLLLD